MLINNDHSVVKWRENIGLKRIAGQLWHVIESADRFVTLNNFLQAKKDPVNILKQFIMFCQS